MTPVRPAQAPHIPVLIGRLIEHAGEISSTWLDGTLGAGGYARALLDAGAAHVIGIDQDPSALSLASKWASHYPDRLTLICDNFANLDQHGHDLAGIVLDLGVSSMQLDQAERGFSFMRDGPLDMRMRQEGRSAADIIAHESEQTLADIFFHFGEERASRRIAKRIVKARDQNPIRSTLELADLITQSMPKAKPGQSHPATRCFQALRIAVNLEFQSLLEGLNAAEKALGPGGILAVVSFHSLEDRMAKRFFQIKAGRAGRANRYAPQSAETHGQFEQITTKAIGASAEEIAQNPRARSALLRMGRRSVGPARPLLGQDLKMPILQWDN